jgi:plasmid stabilization system protein ParE
VAQIVWTREAERWLSDIYEYIASDNPVAAAETIQGIFDRAQVLEDFPESGARYWASPRHVRILLYGHYRITYLVRDDGDIDILGVFHGALDIDKYSL